MLLMLELAAEVVASEDVVEDATTVSWLVVVCPLVDNLACWHWDDGLLQWCR